MAVPGETGDASAVGVPDPVAGSAVLDRSTMFASVREPRLCTYEQHELVLLPGHLVFFAGWHARSCECAVPQDRDFWEPDVGVLVGASCQSVGHGYSLYELRCPPTPNFAFLHTRELQVNSYN